jgi:O-antigen ligase
VHPRLRFWLITTLGACAGVVAAYQLAHESFAFAAVLVGALLWLILEWRGGPWPEAWAVAVLLAGNILANRGFAQLSLLGQIPLLPAEAVLGVAVVGVGFRMVLRQTAAGTRDGLNLAVLVWMLIGAARLWPDFRAHGFLAIRDFATVYYALFFFAAQAFASHAPSARLIRRTVLIAMALLPLTFFAYGQFANFFLQRLTIRGVPFVYYKDDLVAAYLMTAFFLMMTLRPSPLVRSVIALAAYATAFNINSSRAAIVGLIVTSGWWAVARRWAPWKLQALAIPLGVLALAVVALVDRKDFSQSRLFGLYEHVASIVDIGGGRSYVSDERRFSGDNNRFRLVWWRAVIDETRETSPLFGLGFGADLAERFVRSYQQDLGEEFNARSPHSVIFTVLGRTGLVGLLAFLGIIAAMTVKTLRLARLARHDDRGLLPLGWWSVSWVMIMSACFGVVLEGPMGAVVFWTALGMANATSHEVPASPPTETSAGSASPPSLAGEIPEGSTEPAVAPLQNRVN